MLLEGARKIHFCVTMIRVGILSRGLKVGVLRAFTKIGRRTGERQGCAQLPTTDLRETGADADQALLPCCIAGMKLQRVDESSSKASDVHFMRASNRSCRYKLTHEATAKSYQRYTRDVCGARCRSMKLHRGEFSSAGSVAALEVAT